MNCGMFYHENSIKCAKWKSESHYSLMIATLSTELRREHHSLCGFECVRACVRARNSN